MIEEKKLAEMRTFAEQLKLHKDTTKNAFVFADMFDQCAVTLVALWKIVRAGQEHIRTHGHTSDVTLEDELIAAGLADPAKAEWRKKLKK